MDDFNHKLKPIYYAIQELATRENVGIAGLNSQIDSYFAVKNPFQEKMRKFHMQCITTSKREDIKNFVDNSLNVMKEFQSDIFEILGQRMSQETGVETTKRVSFGDISVSVFTTQQQLKTRQKALH